MIPLSQGKFYNQVDNTYCFLFQQSLSKNNSAPSTEGKSAYWVWSFLSKHVDLVDPPFGIREKNKDLSKGIPKQRGIGRRPQNAGGTDY